jgi:type I restriction enzyme S subunit
MAGNGFYECPHLGLIPNDWVVVNAIDVCTKITDGTHDTPSPTEQGVPYIKSVHIKKGSINFDICLFLCQEDHDIIYARCNPERGDLLIVNIGIGNIGHCAYVDINFEFSMKNIALLKPDPKKINGKYLYHYYKSRQQKITNSTKTGGAQPFLSLRDLRKLKIVVPPIIEQIRIASILDTWDQSISTTECLIDNSKQQKKALMQQLLTGKKRLFDDAREPFEREWKEVQLSNISNIIMGSSPKSSAYNKIGEGLPLLQGNADIKERKSRPRIHTSEITKECQVGDILLSVRAPVGSVAKSLHHACIGRGISAITAKDNYSQGFLYQWLLWYEPRWESLSQGSTFEAVNSNDIKSLHLTIPNIEEQEKIAAVLTNADKDTNLLEQQLADLKQEKKALMQQLLTGKRRVKVDQTDTGSRAS